MIPPPPRSTLFPYTTLFRSSRASVAGLRAISLRADETGRGTAQADSRRCEVQGPLGDRKSTRLNSSHGYISYAVFCLKKKNCSKHVATFDQNPLQLDRPPQH